MVERAVGILLFDEVEVLDFAGPFEVFAVTGEITPGSFRTITVSVGDYQVRARNGLRVIADYDLDDCPKLDVLVVPGGYGTRALIKRPDILEWISTRASEAEVALSVCTGSIVFAYARLLGGLPATTHHSAMERLAEADKTIDVREDERVIDTGRIITSGGISAGIDASLHLVARLLDPEVARRTAVYMEYDGTWEGYGPSL